MGERGEELDISDIALSESIESQRRVLAEYADTGVNFTAVAVRNWLNLMASQAELARTLEQQNAELIDLNGMAGWLDGRVQ